MGYLRLFRRVRIAPGLTLNLSKSGPSLSLGVRGAHLTIGTSGIRRTVGIPGTGIFYTSHSGWHSGAHTAQTFQDAVGELRPHEHFVNGLLILLLVLFGIGIVAAITVATASH
jgi:uncharacterized protein DUF4236